MSVSAQEAVPLPGHAPVPGVGPRIPAPVLRQARGFGWSMKRQHREQGRQEDWFPHTGLPAGSERSERVHKIDRQCQKTF